MSKRRRRPKTSSKRKINPLKVVLITGGFLLICLVIVLLIAKSSLDAWLKGAGFRDFLANKASVILKSEVDLGSTRWEGSQVYVEGVSARGFEDAAFARLNLDSVRATNGGSKKGIIQIPEVKINRMNLEFSPLRKKGRFPMSANTGGDGNGLPDWLIKWLPKGVAIDEIRIDAGNLEINSAVGEKILNLKSVRAEVRPDFETQTWEIKGQGGNFHVESLPPMKLRDMALRWKNRNLFLNRLSLGIFKNGDIDSIGEVSFEGSAPKLDIELNVSRIDVHEVMLDDEWKKRLSGILRGKIMVLGNPGDLRQEGTIYLEEGLLKSLPVLETIAGYTRSEKFKRLALNETHSDFVRKGDRIELRNLVIQSDGLLRLVGDVDIDGKQLRGNLRVGVVPGTLRWIPGAEQTVFTESKDGFLWTPMTLAGTTENPEEDLSNRLILAAGEAILKELPEETLNQAQKLLSGEKGSSGVGDKAGGVINQGKKVIDLLSPLLFGQ